MKDTMTADHGSDRSGSTLNRNLLKLFEPESMVLVGASKSRWKWGFRFLYNIVCGGYSGTLYGVHPEHDDLFGVPTFPSVSALPEAVDLALVVVPPKEVPEAVRQCAALGVKAVVIITAGFGELEDGQARAAQEEIVSAVRDSDTVVVGPNCAGVVSPEPCNLYGSMFSTESALAGGISMVSQSGNVMGTLLRWAKMHQLGVARLVSSGNEAATSTEDFLGFFADDARTKVILAYVEGVPDGRAFFEALQNAAQRKPVVVIKGGRHPGAIKATQSHTGSLGTPMNLFRAACRQAGAILVDDPYEAFALCAAFEKQPLPQGRRVAIITFGGGWGVLAADACEDAGLELAELPDETVAELDTFLPPWWSRGNPLDLVAGLRNRDDPARVAEIVLQCSNVDALVFYGLGFGSLGDQRDVSKELASRFGIDLEKRKNRPIYMDNEKRLAQLQEQYGKPVVVVSEAAMTAYGSSPNVAIAELERQGVGVAATVTTPGKTLACLAGRYEFVQDLQRKSAT